MSEVSIDSKWYAIHTRANYENRIARQLFDEGAETFVPTRKVTRSWSDRIKELTSPIFPGYVFCRTDLSTGPRLVSVNGVLRILGIGNKPEPVPAEEIECLKLVVQSGLSIAQCPFIQLGERVSIRRGPLTGATGYITGNSGDAGLVVSIEILQRSLTVKIDPNWATPISGRRSFEATPSVH